jgi:hypothetical protein
MDKIEEKLKAVIKLQAGNVKVKPSDYEGYKKQIESIDNTKKAVEQLNAIEKVEIRFGVMILVHKPRGCGSN